MRAIPDRDEAWPDGAGQRALKNVMAVVLADMGAAYKQTGFTG